MRYSGVVRVDDFPSGIREIEKDLSNFFKIFDKFEENNIYFYLGIVPALLHYVSQENLDRLLTYKYLIPCQHGYEHRYKEMSAKLIACGDIRNDKTIGCFDEFEYLPVKDIENKILQGRISLQTWFEKKIDTYIPVCNTITEPLIKVLNDLNFKTIFTTEPTKNYETGGLTKMLTNFSGRLREISVNNYDCICLHATWENDVIKEIGWDNWVKDFNKVFGVEEEPVECFNVPTQVNTIIPRVANFYWNLETPLSYLRFLTILSFRHFHPDWKMNLWVSGSNTKNFWKGQTEQQEFQTGGSGKDYLLDTLKYEVNILQFNYPICKGLAPNYISDIARFRTIDNGGWFFDLDQIFTKSFDGLCRYDFVTGIGYVDRINCGVLGSSEKSLVPLMVYKRQIEMLSANNGKQMGYCDLGNHFLNDCFYGANNISADWDGKKNEFSKEFNSKTANELHLISGSELFYPVSTSPEVDILYSGEMKISELKNNFAVHWYGGHPKSQEFNKIYNENFAKFSNDSISVYLREIGLI